MNYRVMPKTGDKLSALGYGCMRFPRKGGGIDQARTTAQVRSAIERGVNYFDTAYVYPGSEQALGNALAGGWRDKVKVATKLPHMLIKKPADMQMIFDTQLKRLQTDHIDYYMMHNIVNFSDWERVKSLGVIEFLEDLRASGRVRCLGFSSHANLQTFRKLVDDYDWDFCQIQYNYLDENFQAGKAGLLYAAQKGLGIIVMEPLRGGILGEKIPPAAAKLLSKSDPARSPADWAIRWLLSHPEVGVVLSGMGVESHIDQNIRAASATENPTLSEQELRCLEEVKAVFAEKVKVPCTGCAYCVPCPYKVDIPACFALYNNQSVHGGMYGYFHYINSTEGLWNGQPTRASNCKNCGVCVKLCPQQIDIPGELARTAKKMEKPYLRIPAKIYAKFVARK